MVGAEREQGCDLDAPGQDGGAMEAGPTGICVKTDAKGRTNVQAVFAAGNLASPKPFAIFAAASGATARLTCDQELAGLFG